MEKEIAAFILYNNKGQILLQQRPDESETQNLPNYWVIFNGGIKFGEKPIQTAKRESIEELDYNLKNPQLIYEKEFNYNGSRKVYAFIEKYNPQKTLTLKEGQDMGWFFIDETERLQMTSLDREILAYLKSIFDFF